MSNVASVTINIRITSKEKHVRLYDGHKSLRSLSAFYLTRVEGRCSRNMSAIPVGSHWLKQAIGASDEFDSTSQF